MWIWEESDTAIPALEFFTSWSVEWKCWEAAEGEKVGDFLSLSIKYL